MKWGWSTRCIPEDALQEIRPSEAPPRVGDLAVARVVEINKHTRIEGRDWRRANLFPGDYIGGVFGNRFATDQFEGYVEPFQETCHLLGIGAVLGTVRSQNERMSLPPTILEPLGYAHGRDGARLSMLDFGLPEAVAGLEVPNGIYTILVVGSAMNSGKTTTAAHTILGLSRAGARVCAAKLTGTACAKDSGYFMDAGALKVLDFSDCGWPSTFLAGEEQLHDIYARIRFDLSRLKPDYIVLELADGLWQRETEMLLRSSRFSSTIDAVIFAANESHSAESGVNWLKQVGHRVVATSGVASTSVLSIDEVTRATGLPCLSRDSLADGALRPLLRHKLAS